MPRIPEFFKTIEKIVKLHQAKNQDYATKTDPFSNFRFTEYVLDHFPNNRDKSFVWPIATKLARLANLMSNDATPNFESIEDSFDDIATYVILWKCDVMRDIEVKQNQTQYDEQSGPEPPDLENQRTNLNLFIDGLNEHQLKRLRAIAYDIVREPQEITTEGRTNYAIQSDQGKHPGFPHVSPAQRRAAESNQRDRPDSDRDRE